MKGLSPDHPLYPQAMNQRAKLTQAKAFQPVARPSYYGAPSPETRADPMGQAEFAQRGIMPPSSAPAISADQQRFNARRDQALGPYRNPDAIFNPQTNPVSDPNAFWEAREKSLAPPTNDEKIATHGILQGLHPGHQFAPPQLAAAGTPGGYAGPPSHLRMPQAPAPVPVGIAATTPQAGQPNVAQQAMPMAQRQAAPGQAPAPRPQAIPDPAANVPAAVVGPAMPTAPDPPPGPTFESIAAAKRNQFLKEGNVAGVLGIDSALELRKQGMLLDAARMMEHAQGAAINQAFQGEMLALGPGGRADLEDPKLTSADRAGVVARSAPAGVVARSAPLQPLPPGVTPKFSEAQPYLAAKVPEYNRILQSAMSASDPTAPIDIQKVFSGLRNYGYDPQGMNDPTSEMARMVIADLSGRVGADVMSEAARQRGPQDFSFLQSIRGALGGDPMADYAKVNQLAEWLRRGNVKPPIAPTPKPQVTSNSVPEFVHF